MDQLVQCPVCTLYLHNGMSLESHLDTHPKDQVIRALCSLTTKSSSSYGSRTPTPVHSERSYRSRSRTPATDDRWAGSHRSSDNERYWRRTPSRTSKSSQVMSSSRNGTPDTRLADINFDNNLSSSLPYSGTPLSLKTDKTQQNYVNNPSMSDYDQQYVYYQDSQEDREIKYSRSAEYAPMDNNNVFSHNIPSTVNSGAKTTLVPAASRKGNDNIMKLLPKPNNILVKSGGVQYITPGGKPMHMKVPTAPTFIQKNVQNNMIMTSGISGTQHGQTKIMPTQLSSNQFNQMTSSTFTPGTTVVQNSQIIYREMVHNIDGKRFISCVPSVLSHENVTNVSQGTSMYQNLMVVDQLGNASCMYTTPQQMLPKPCNTSMYSDMSHMTNSSTHEENNTCINDANKTLIIEVGPIVPQMPQHELTITNSITTQTDIDLTNPRKLKKMSLHRLEKNDTPGPSKGLKILSNIKVEVPVRHHKNLLNKVLDLTGSNDLNDSDRAETPETILPDLDSNADNMDNNHMLSDDCTQPSIASSDSVVSHTFSVIKNVGNPPSYKDSSNKSSLVDGKIEAEFSDSCPVPDLICNEKPSISPCSELSENGENSTDRTSISPKPQCSLQTKKEENVDKLTFQTQKPHRSNTLRLNNIYVKKNKKILQIKNAKSSLSISNHNDEPRASSSSCRSPENYSMNKNLIIEKIEKHEKSNTLKTISVEQINDNNDDHNFDADTEEQSMDIEPVAPSSLKHSDQFSTSIDVVQVKEEINTSNEEGFGNEIDRCNRELSPMETLRPINVIAYGNMPPADFDEESNHRELLELEAASKNKQFVNMINENYFGDNVYADYFTPDRVESFDTERESSGFVKEGPKDGMYIWGESSHRETEFVLPTFIHESYKIAESSGIDYSEIGNRGDHGEACDGDNKADVLSESHSDGEPPLNICADEHMPPRGELSGQESNGDMESAWQGMYPDVPPAAPYDLIARESWVSDGSEMDANEKRDNLEEELHFPKGRVHTCTQCGAKLPTLKELRAHKNLAHPPPGSSGKGSYSRLLTARAIKKEEKVEENVIPGNILQIDSKESILPAQNLPILPPPNMLQVYDTLPEAKPKIEALIKQELKPRRRRDYVCPTCKVDQLTDVAFHAHLKIHPLECLICGKCFFRRANLALHIKTHLGIKNFKCEVCEKRFITKQKLSEHHNIHTGRAPVKCTLCDQTFRRHSNMLQHRARHHFRKKAKVRDFVCQCGAVFHSRAKLHWHQETHDGKPKACLYCSDKFLHQASLTRHVRRTHHVYYTDNLQPSRQNVACPVCKQVYLRSNLRAHLLNHSGKRPHVCVICNKAFTTKWNLKLHRWTHMGRSAKPYKCTLCKGAFIRHAEFVAHMNAHKSVRPYTCNYCGCQFIRKYNCQRHVREHEMAKKYVCKVPECGKSFHRSYYLSEHMKVHSGARPFSCNICGKTSSNKSNHNKHLKIHHAREPVATEA